MILNYNHQKQLLYKEIMKNNHFMHCMASLALLLVAGLAQAVSYPKYPVQTLTDGQTYVLANLSNPQGYMCRTSWDNALVMQDRATFDGQYGVLLTARYDEALGLWYFVTSETTSQDEDDVETTDYTYLGIPAGTNNVRAMQQFGEIPYFQVTPGTTAGFYQLRVAQGHEHIASIGVLLHLNAGGTYPIANEPTNSWYPDFYGGIAIDEDNIPVVIYDEETGVNYNVMADSTSCNWGFVALEDIDVYNQMGASWNEVKTFAANEYFTADGYADGFQLTLAAAEALLQKEGFTADDQETIHSLIQARVELYNQLVKAQDLDASNLASAIAAAQQVFDSTADVDALHTAYLALKKACDDFALGLGDITAIGENMSFEDLSAQGGAPTSGVAGAPAGWNVYINGQQAYTAGEVSALGVTAWHGINEDSEGYKDGQYSFGLWTAAVPEYEISQTITGLDNGTYTITCGLMVGANGGGSRRTTQRVFGNYNSTLFGGEAEYLEGILPTEYKTYADLTEPTTDREMQQISVRAYVYDGTLTFGIRTNGDHDAALRDWANGGEGWFKTDNFTIYKEGFDADDQRNLYNYLSDALDQLAAKPMDATYSAKYKDIKFDDLDKGIAAIGNLLDEAAQQAAAYEPLFAALELAIERLSTCEEAGYTGLDDFYDFYDTVNSGYENGEYTADQVSDIIAQLEQAYQDCLHSGVSEGADVSDLIVNRSFEDLRNQGGANSDGVVAAPYGWNLYLNGELCQTADEIRAQGVTAWCAINSGDNISVTDELGNYHDHQYTDGTHVWGIWNSSIPQVELSQTLTGLKPGTYMLTADVMARNTDWSGDNLTTQRIFANGAVCLYGSENDYIPEFLENTTSDDVFRAYDLTVNQGIFLDETQEYEFFNYAGWDASTNDILLRTLTLHFGVGEDGVATFGFRTDNLDGWTGEPQTEQAAGWFKLDNFTLYYESSSIPTRIDETVAPVQPAAALYDLAGRRVSQARKGVYIQNGKKVLK